MIKFIGLLVLRALLFLLVSTPESMHGFSQHSWEYYYERGLIQFRAGMYDYSTDSMEKCLEANPGCFTAANVLAQIYLKKEKKSKAIEYYKQSLIVNDNQPDIHCFMGELYEHSGEKDMAFRHFMRATEIEGNHIRAHCNLVRHLINRGDKASAELHFNTSNRAALQRSGRTLLDAINAHGDGDMKNVVLLYGKLIEECPCLLDAYLGLYGTRIRMKDYKGAAEALERLTFVKPDHEKAYVLLGNLYFTQRLPGKRKVYLDKAIANLLKAIELNPNNYEACYALSGIYHYIRKDIEAKSYEDKAREIEKRVEGTQ